MTETKDSLFSVLCEVEVALGENLVWISDQADLGVRQKDPETLRRLKQLSDAWELVVRTLNQKVHTYTEQLLGGN